MATTKIPAEFLADNTIVALSIAENIISTRELAANGITSAQIASNAILTRHIDDNQITGDQIADNSVGTPQLAGIARGKIIVGDASGNPSLLSLGSNGYVLKSDGSDIAWAEDATVAALTSEQVQDIAGAMFSSNTETGIAATYEDGDGTIDLVIGANVIVSGMIAQNSILTRHIDDDQVTEAQLANSINADIATGVAALPKAGGAMTGNLAMAANNVNVNDNGKVQFGNSDDLQIYHDGSNSYIDEGGTGILYIRSNDVRLMKADGSETMLQADDDGAVNLFHNNAVKLQTEAGGVHITGYADADNFKVAGAQGSDGQVLTSTGSGVAWEAAAGTTINNNADNRVITGSGTANTLEGESNLVFTGANLGIGTTSPAVPLDIVSNAGGNAVVLRARSADDYAFMIFKNNAGSAVAGQIYNHSGAIKFTTGTSATERLTIDTAGKVHIGNTFSADGSYDNLVIGTGSGNEGMTIYGAANGASSIAFADPNDNDVGSIMYDHSSNFMRFNTNAGERMRIDSSGRVGINRTPSVSSTKLEIGGADDTQLLLLEASGHTGGLGIGATGLQFFSNSTVRGKFDQTGEFLVNRTDGFGTGGAAAMFVTGRSDCGIYVTGSNSSGYALMAFLNGGLNQIGAIKNLNNNALTFYSNSDYRLKENVDYTWDATTRLKQLKPARFNWISDDSNTAVDGFLAHEVSSIVPDAVDGVKDATKTSTNCVLNSEGNLQRAGITEEEWVAGKAETPPRFESNTSWTASHTQDVYQAIDESKLVPLLVKTIQELEARITVLES